MYQPANSKSVPGLPDEEEILTPNNAPNINSVKIYDGVADCTMNDADTIKNVKIRAKDLAQDNLLKKIADYVDAFLKDRLLTFPHDEILAIANEIYHVTDVKYNMLDSDDYKMMIRATVLAKVDDNDIMNCLVRFFKERTEFKLQIDNLKRQIEEFPKKITLANKNYFEANNLRRMGDYKGAMKLYTEAIELNPNFFDYSNRGDAYKAIGEEEKAQADFAKAEELREG